MWSDDEPGGPTRWRDGHRNSPWPPPYAGTAYFPIGRAADTLACYRDWAARQPAELNVSIVLTKNSPVAAVSGPVLAVRGLYAGEEDDAAGALRPLWRAAGTPLVDGFRGMDYAETGTIGGTGPHHFELFADLPDPVIDSIVNVLDGADAVEVRHWGGAMAQPGAGAGPVGHREIPFSVTIEGPADAAASFPHYATGGSFLNFLHDPAKTRGAYTAPNYQRLRELKRAYDPDNVFGRVHNIPPSPTARHE